MSQFLQNVQEHEEIPRDCIQCNRSCLIFANILNKIPSNKQTVLNILTSHESTLESNANSNPGAKVLLDAYHASKPKAKSSVKATPKKSSSNSTTTSAKKTKK